MAKIKKINLFSLAKFQAVLMTLVGLIAGIAYSFGGAAYDVITTGSMNLGTVLAFLSLLGMPVIFGAAGFVIGYLEAILYNFFAKRFNGVELEFEH